MNRWVQFVGWFLIALTLVIVIMPQFDLPPTINHCYCLFQHRAVAAELPDFADTNCVPCSQEPVGQPDRP